MDKYLQSSQYIDWKTETVLAKAQELAKSSKSQTAIAEACFTFVRDQIKHSWDYKLNPVTCAASDVLEQGTGYCYAKSHLLAALLRANKIPAALCYQRLTIEDNKPPFCLHGLNAVYLESHGWYRVDARGNKQGVNAQFSPPTEQLAFPIVIEGEANLPELYDEPMPIIIQALTSAKDYQSLADNLPDTEVL